MLHRETYIHNEINAEWLSSTEARTFLKINSCTIAHLRLDGKLTFERKRNAFFYSAADCRIMQAKTKPCEGNARENTENRWFPHQHRKPT